MARTPESAAVDFAESSLFTGRFSILALAACGVGFSLSGRLPAAIFSLAAAAVAAAEQICNLAGYPLTFLQSFPWRGLLVYYLLGFALLMLGKFDTETFIYLQF